MIWFLENLGTITFAHLLDIVLVWCYFSAFTPKTQGWAMLRWFTLIFQVPLCLFAYYYWPLVTFAAVLIVSFTYEMPMKKRAMLSAAYAVVAALVFFSVWGLTSAFMGAYLYDMALIISKLVFYVIIVAMRRYSGGPREVRGKGTPLSVLLFVMPIVSFGISFALLSLRYNGFVYFRLDEILCFTAVVLIALVNFVIIIVGELQQSRQVALQDELSQKQYEETQTVHYAEIADRQSVANRTMHDLKNRLYGLREIIEKDQEYAKRTIDEIIENVSYNDLSVKTGIESVDALLSSKYAVMKKKDIHFSIKAFCPANNHIDVMDLCIVLGNLLDNAIDANEKVQGDRYIKLTMNQVGPVLNITVVNRSPGDSYDLETTKSDKAYHGYGIKSIKQIAEKYDGGAVFVPGTGLFTAYISLYNS